MISILNVFSGAALSVESTYDYQSLNTNNSLTGLQTVLASKPIIGYTASFSMKIKNQLGVRLKYKKQKSVFVSPEGQSLVGDRQDVDAFAIESPYQHNNYLKTFFRYQYQERLFISFDELNNLSLAKVGTNNFGYGVQIESPVRVGFGWGIDVWGAIISIPAQKRRSKIPNDGVESGVSFKTTFNEKNGTGYILKCSYLKADFSGGEPDFVFKELSYSLGVVWRFGN